MIRTIIADDHEMVLKGLEAILSATGKYSIVGSVCNGQNLVNIVRQKEADLVLIDYNMPILNGLEALMELKEISRAKLVFITSTIDEWLVTQSKELGASGVIIKSSNESLLLEKLDKIIKGEKSFPTEKELYDYLYSPLKKKYGLTTTETNTIKALNEGLTVNELAEKNFVSTETIKSHKKNAFIKLGIKKATDLIWFMKRINSSG